MPIDAETMLRVVGRAQFGLLGLFLEADHAAFAIDFHYAEVAGLSRLNQNGGDGHVGAGVTMLARHQVVIHLVDVVARQDEHVLRLLGADGINVLVHRVGGTHVPVLAHPLHGRQNLDELANLAAIDVSPAFANVTVQRQRLVLGQDVDLAQVRVHAIGKRDVDDAIDAAEGYGRLGTVTGEGIKALSCAAGQQDSQSFSH